MKKYIFIIFTSLLAAVLFAYSRSFQSNSIWLFSGVLIYLVVGFLWNKSKISAIQKFMFLATPILLDTIFMQIIVDFRPILLLMPIFAFFGLCIGLFFKKKLFYGLALASLVVANIFTSFYFIPFFVFQKNVETDNRNIPDVLLMNTSMDSLTKKDFEGKVVLIDLWYAKCGACFAQFGETEKIYQHFKDNPKVIVMAVNTGIDKFDLFYSAYRLIKEKKGYNFPVWIDTQMSLVKSLQIQEFPTNIIISPKGKIQFIHKGFSKDEEAIYSKKMIAIIEQLLY